MSVIYPLDRRMLLTTGLATGGLALGAFFWLWSEHGATVYLNYLAGAAFTCF